jgi:hypothetical protein
MPDEVLQATGRTGLLSFAITIEHVSRILLIVLQLGKFGFPTRFYASIIGSVIKSLVSWFINGQITAGHSDDISAPLLSRFFCHVLSLQSIPILEKVKEPPSWRARTKSSHAPRTPHIARHDFSPQ